MNQSLETKRESFLQSLALSLDACDMHLHNLETAKAETNSLSLQRRVLGVVYPRTIEQLQGIVKAAAKFGVALYPVSQGKNIGYGEMTPTTEDQLVVGLKHLNAIRAYDAECGEVIVEPGVTQGQLASFLKEKKSRFWADVTGASPDASIIGNTLEAGFGHTPIGNHRQHILQIEALTADGNLLTTAEMPAIGPDLAQLFVQSNFAIVTAMKIPLFPIPEETLTFTISFSTDEKFFEGISILAQLRREGTITSLMHTANSTRALMTASRFPKSYDRIHVLSEKECLTILNANSPVRFGAWSCIGGLYGFKSEVKAKKARLKKALKGIGKIQTFTDSKLKLLTSVLQSETMRRFSSLDLVRNSLASVRALHGILRGQPSEHPSQNIFWRVDQIEHLGLIWHAPVIPATSRDVNQLMTVARQVFQTHGFEMPVTLTLIDPKHMTAVFNISYDKRSSDETLRAHEAYRALSDICHQLGYAPYRVGLGSKILQNYSGPQFQLLQTLKRALDPQNILAPGRYGLGSPIEN